jgi:hypothetical protein
MFLFTFQFNDYLQTKLGFSIPRVALPFIAWALWVSFGTIFYAIHTKLGWAKGFYMAINVGYSIGEWEMNFIHALVRAFIHLSIHPSIHLSIYLFSLCFMA